jgi:phage-related holin
MNIITPLIATAKSWQGIFLIGTISIFAPLTPILYAMLFLIFADALTGIVASYYKNKVDFHFWSRTSWKHITSKKLAKTLSKSLMYILLIISAFTVDHYIINSEIHYFVRALSGGMAIRELFSIVENVEHITGGKIFDLIKAVFTKGIKGGVDAIKPNDDEDK